MPLGKFYNLKKNLRFIFIHYIHVTLTTSQFFKTEKCLSFGKLFYGFTESMMLKIVSVKAKSFKTYIFTFIPQT